MTAPAARQPGERMPPQEDTMPTTLRLTPARRRLLADVLRHRVYQHPDGASLNVGASGRQVTTRIAHLEGAGWVRLGEGSDYDVRYWELTDAGRKAAMSETYTPPTLSADPVNGDTTHLREKAS